MNISFGHTWPAFAAQAKDTTRRNWKKTHAGRIRVGMTLDALNTATFLGGRKIGTLVVESVARERWSTMPDADYLREGFAWFNAQDRNLIPEKSRDEVWARDNCSFEAFTAWRRQRGSIYVVRYRITHVEDWAKRALEVLLKGKRNGE